jgi:molybdate transport system substrate-binding protein
MKRRALLGAPAWALAGLLAWLLPSGAMPARADAPVTVFAAASLTDSMRDVSGAWQTAGHAKLVLSFAASSTLARQIQQGAPANVFISADQQWMEFLAKSDLIVPGTRKNLLGNGLVLIAPKDQAKPVAIAPGMDLAALLGADGRLATGDPAHVPAGIYGKQALTKLGLWPQVEAHLARTEDVRGALLLVARGEAPLGIVYATDAAVDPGVAIVGTFPADSHPPITYPAAVVRGQDTKEARALLAFLSGPQATAIFRKRGFSIAP